MLELVSQVFETAVQLRTAEELRTALWLITVDKLFATICLVVCQQPMTELTKLA